MVTWKKNVPFIGSVVSNSLGGGGRGLLRRLIGHLKIDHSVPIEDEGKVRCCLFDFNLACRLAFWFSSFLVGANLGLDEFAYGFKVIK